MIGLTFYTNIEKLARIYFGKKGAIYVRFCAVYYLFCISVIPRYA